MNQSELESLSRNIGRFIGELRLFQANHKGDLTNNGNEKLMVILDHMTILQRRLEACLNPTSRECQELGKPIDWNELKNQISNVRRSMNNGSPDPNVSGLMSMPSA